MGGVDKDHLRALERYKQSKNKTSLIRHLSWKQGRGMLKPMTLEGHGECSIGFDSMMLCKTFSKYRGGETRVGLGSRLSMGKVGSQQWCRPDSRPNRWAGKRSREGRRLRLRNEAPTNDQG